MLNEMKAADMMVIDGGGYSTSDSNSGGGGGASGTVRDIAIYTSGAVTANLMDDAINYCKAAVVTAVKEGRPITTTSSQILRNSWW